MTPHRIAVSAASPKAPFARLGLLAGLALAGLAAPGCAESTQGDALVEQTAALTAEQCSFFAVNDTVTFCHAANLKKGKFVLLRTNADGCIHGHAGHAGDFISVDGTCDNAGCFPVGAPYDGTVACCDNMDVVEGACACLEGYETRDEATCVDIDECAEGLDKCDANATCANTEGSYTCTCDAGYEGDGFTCTDVDECKLGLDKCDANATCTNKEGGYACACDEGFKGDGFTCADLDERELGLDKCDANAACANTEGSYTCTCAAGYQGDGFTCTDLDECKDGTAKCDANATCGNTVGAYTCACNKGYEGDGFTCTKVGPSCGDGVVNQATELCDLGEKNGVAGSGCKADCTLEANIKLSAKIHEHCDANSVSIEFTQDTAALDWPSYLNRPSYVTLAAHTGIILYSGYNFTGQQVTLTANTNFCGIRYPNGSGVNDNVGSFQLFYVP